MLLEKQHTRAQQASCAAAPRSTSTAGTPDGGMIALVAAVLAPSCKWAFYSGGACGAVALLLFSSRFGTELQKVLLELCVVSSEVEKAAAEVDDDRALGLWRWGPGAWLGLRRRWERRHQGAGLVDRAFAQMTQSLWDYAEPAAKPDAAVLFDAIGAGFSCGFTAAVGHWLIWTGYDWFYEILLLGATLCVYYEFIACTATSIRQPGPARLEKEQVLFWVMAFIAAVCSHVVLLLIVALLIYRQWWMTTQQQPGPARVVTEWVDGQHHDPAELALKRLRVRVEGHGEGEVREFQKAWFGASAHVVCFDEGGEKTVYLQRNGNGQAPFKVQTTRTEKPGQAEAEALFSQFFSDACQGKQKTKGKAAASSELHKLAAAARVAAAAS